MFRPTRSFQCRAAPHLRVFAATMCVTLAACGGDSSDIDIDVAEIDQESSVAVTDDELANFEAPGDSMLEEAQVIAHLRTSLLQFDLIREESMRLRGEVQAIEDRGGDGGALSQLQNMVAAGRTLFQTVDLVGGSYVRSARALGYNPAEMEWVRDRFVDVSRHLVVEPMREQAVEGAAGLRAQAEQLREASSGDPGLLTQIEEMIAAAKDVESSGEFDVPRATTRNLEVLRQTRSSVTDEMWVAIGLAGGASGLVALAGWEDPGNPRIAQHLDELRTLYQSALDNREYALPKNLR